MSGRLLAPSDVWSRCYSSRVAHPNPAGSQYGPHQPPEPIVVNSGNRVKVGGLILVCVCGVPGLVTFLTGIAGLFDDSDDHTGVIIASCIGAALLAFGVYGVYKTITMKPFRFVVDGCGVRMEQTGGKGWQLAWFEIAGVWLSTATKSHMGAFGRSDLHSTLVRLEFVPLDQRRFAFDHPNLHRYYGRQNRYGAYRIPLGPGRAAVPVFDETLRAFAQGRYRGVVDEGMAWGLRYT